MESSGYKIDCKTRCDECISRGKGCASDYGEYPSECEAHAQTCKMYGMGHVKNITITSCQRKCTAHLVLVNTLEFKDTG